MPHYEKITIKSCIIYLKITQLSTQTYKIHIYYYNIYVIIITSYMSSLYIYYQYVTAFENIYLTQCYCKILIIIIDHS